MFSLKDLENYLNSRDFDIRKTHNGRWIDQKCTPDVLWSISDFVLNYVENINTLFTPSDIWKSDYAKETISETYSKPKTDAKSAENEYDKVFSQPLSLLCYAGVLEDISPTSKHLYRVKHKEMLEFIAMNDMCSLRFLQTYIEKVMRDSGLFKYFEWFFEYQDTNHFDMLKNAFVRFYHANTPVNGDYEPKRIFTKVLNPLAHKYRKKGTARGRMSENKINKADMMYNQDNFRDIYYGKPKDVTRKEWLNSHPKIQLKTGYFKQMLNKAKIQLRKYNAFYRKNISELTQFDENHNDVTSPSQVHHIFPKNEFPEIMHYFENLIVLTPNQHFNFAHPNNKTSSISVEAQKDLLIAKTYSIKANLESIEEDDLYEFNNLLYVLKIGWNDDAVLEIEENDYLDVVRSISLHYQEIT